MTTATDPLDALGAAETASGGVPQAPIGAISYPAPKAVLRPASTDPLDQLGSAEHEDRQIAEQIVGEHATTQEQQGYDAQIAANRAATPVTPYQSTQGMDTLKDVGHRIAQLPEGIYSGAVHAVSELAIATAGLATLNTPQMAWEYLSSKSSDPEIQETAARNAARLAEFSRSVRAGADAITPDADTLSGDLAKGVTQFVAGFVPISRAAGLANIASTPLRIGATALATGTAQAAVFNPNDSRLSNLIQQFPALKNPITDYLASKPGDSVADGRLKGFIEGAVSGIASDTAIEGTLSILKGMRGSIGLANSTKAVADAKPTDIDHAAPQAPLTPEQHAAVAAQATTKPWVPPSIDQAATAHPVEATAAAPTGERVAPATDGTAAHVATSDSLAIPHEGTPATTPGATGEATSSATAGETVVAPNVASAGAPAVEVPRTFDPAATAVNAIKIAPEQSAAFLKALTEGRYNDIPGVLDDTHRTIPWDTLSDGANLKGLFNAMTDHFGDAIRAASGPVSVTDSTIVQLAKDIGGDTSALAATYGNLTDQGGLAAQITAGYNIMTASARQLRDLADIARPFKAGEPEADQAMLNFQKQLEIHAAIVGQVRQSSSEIGRALNAHRALKASSDVALANISEIAGTVLGPDAARKFLKQVGDAADLSTINGAVDKARGGGLMGVIKEIAQNGMLSGFPTQIANIAGNTGNAIIKVAERYLAGVMGQVRGVFMPDAEVATIRAAVAHTSATVGAIRDSFPLMVKALTTEQSISASGRPMGRAIYRDTTGLTGNELTAAQAINITGQVVRYPGRFMGAVDHLNQAIGMQQDLAARIYTQTAGEADTQGLAGDARDAFMDSRQAELRANPPKAMTDASFESGLYQSFQESARTRFGDGISTMLNSHPLVKLLIAPFVHRPLNMLRQATMDYSVLGLASQTQRATLLAGNADSDLAMARMVIGTGAVISSYEMAANGSLVGSRLGSHNTESLDGIPPHTVKVGNSWYRYDRIDPVGMWLAVGADLQEAFAHYHNPHDPSGELDLATMARMGAQVVGMSAMDKSFMQSVDSFMKAFGAKDPQMAEKLMQNLVSSNAAKFVPFSGALRGAAQATDPVQRSVGGDGLPAVWDQIKKGLPILSKTLPPKRDVLGRPVMNPAGSSAWFNPFAGAPAATDHMDQELSKVAVGVKTPPRQLMNTVLDSHQYDDLLRMSTEPKVFPGGTNLEGYMRALTSSDTWAKYGTTDDHGVMARTKLVQGAIDAAMEYGKGMYLKVHPEFIEQMKAQAMAQAQHFKAAPIPSQVPSTEPPATAPSFLASQPAAPVAPAAAAPVQFAPAIH